MIPPQKELKVWYFFSQQIGSHLPMTLCTIPFLIYESKATAVSTLRGT